MKGNVFDASRETGLANSQIVPALGKAPTCQHSGRISHQQKPSQHLNEISNATSLQACSEITLHHNNRAIKLK